MDHPLLKSSFYSKYGSAYLCNGEKMFKYQLKLPTQIIFDKEFAPKRLKVKFSIITSYFRSVETTPK